jgi:hypothetical protein
MDHEDVEPVAMDHEAMDREDVEPVAMDHETMDHEDAEPVAMDHEAMDREDVEPVAMDHEAMDREDVEPVAMDHEAMDREDVEPVAMDNEPMDHEDVEPVAMDNEAMDHEGAEPVAMDHEAMDHEGAEPVAMDHEAMDHEDVEPVAMDHEAMDHEDGEPVAMDHEAMDHEDVEPVAMDNEAMDHEDVEPVAMDHEAMDHEDVEPVAMDHEAMDHEDVEPVAMDNEAMDHEDVEPVAMDHEAMDHEDVEPVAMDHEAMDHEDVEPVAMDHEDVQLAAEPELGVEGLAVFDPSEHSSEPDVDESTPSADPLAPVPGEEPFEVVAGGLEYGVPDDLSTTLPEPTEGEPSVSLTDLEDLDAIAGPELGSDVTAEDFLVETLPEGPKPASRLLTCRRGMFEVYGDYLRTGEVPSEAHDPIATGDDFTAEPQPREIMVVSRPEGMSNPGLVAGPEIGDEPGQLPGESAERGDHDFGHDLDHDLGPTAGPVVAAESAEAQEEPTRPGALTKAPSRGRWTGEEVPMEALNGDQRLLTPMVGDVRVKFVDGSFLDGTLHAMGQGKVALDTDAGRMTFDARRVSGIDRIMAATGPDSGERDYTRFPLVRVRTEGGMFVGRELSRDGDRITLMTEEGIRMTVHCLGVERADARVRSVGIRKRETE